MTERETNLVTEFVANGNGISTEIFIKESLFNRSLLLSSDSNCKLLIVQLPKLVLVDSTADSSAIVQCGGGHSISNNPAQNHRIVQLIPEFLSLGLSTLLFCKNPPPWCRRTCISLIAESWGIKARCVPRFWWALGKPSGVRVHCHTSTTSHPKWASPPKATSMSLFSSDHQTQHSALGRSGRLPPPPPHRSPNCLKLACHLQDGVPQPFYIKCHKSTFSRLCSPPIFSRNLS